MKYPSLPNFMGMKAVLMGIVLSLSVLTAHGQFTWDGGGADGNWSSDNWTGTAPANSFTDSFTFAGTTNLTTTNDLTGGTANGITFNAGAGAFTLGGSNQVGLRGNITNNSANLQTINFQLGLDSAVATQIDAASGSVYVADMVRTTGTVNAPVTVNASAGTDVEIAHINLGTITKTGDGTLTLSGTVDNNSAALVANGGTTLLTKASGGGVRALGTTMTINSGATVKLDGTGGDLIYDGVDVNIASGGIFDLGGKTETIDQLQTMAGTITNTAAGASSLSFNLDGNETFAGQFLDGLGSTEIVKLGGGNLKLTGANTHSGGTTFNGGINQVKTDANLGATTGALTLNNATLQNDVDPLTLDAARNVVLATGTGATWGGIRAGWNQAITINGKVTGAGELRVVNEGGIVILSNTANDYTGNTVIGSEETGWGGGSRGLIRLGASEVLPDGTTVAFNGGDGKGGVLQLNDLTETVAGVRVDSGYGLVEGATGAAGGTGTLRIAGPAGTIQLSNAATVQTLTFGSHDNSGNLTIGDTGATSGGTLTFDNQNTTNDILVRSNIVDNGTGVVNIDKTGAGTLVVRGNNTYTGTTTVTAGTLDGDVAALPTDIANSGTVIINGAGTWSHVISGTGNFVKTGAGDLVVNPDQTYQGTTTIEQGLVRASTDAKFGAVPSTPTENIFLDGGGIQNNGTGNHPILNANRTVTLVDGSWGALRAGWRSETAGITVQGKVTGGGDLVISNDGSWVTLSNAGNDYTGNTVIGDDHQGTTGGHSTGYNAAPDARFRIGASDVIPDASMVVFNGGTNNGGNDVTGEFNLNGFNETVSGLRIDSGLAKISNTSGTNSTLSVGANNTTSSFGTAGVIQDNLDLIKIGTGTFTLEGANTYSLGTAVNEGTLFVTNTTGSATGTGDVTVNDGGTLGGDGIISGNLSLSGGGSGGSVSPGLSPGTLTLGGNFDVSDIAGDGNGNLIFELGSTSDQIVMTAGTLSIGTGLLGLTDFDFTITAQGTYTLIDTTSLISGTLGSNLSGMEDGFLVTLGTADGGNDLILNVVPEPSSALLALLGGCLCLRRRRKTA